jgi:integrase
MKPGSVAIRWEFTDRNPIAGAGKGSGVRVSAKRERIPDILEVEEMHLLLGALGIREKAMVFLDMPSGLRRGELAGLKWEDFDFKNLHVSVTRSLVDQHVGPVKTEESRKLMPIDEYVAHDLLAWHEVTPYKQPSDYVWTTDANRAGAKRGKQPVWLSAVMRDYIQPAARKLGINKKMSWHTFRHTFSTLLKGNGEDVKVVQELLRHSTAKMTLDTYTQAVSIRTCCLSCDCSTSLDLSCAQQCNYHHKSYIVRLSRHDWLPCLRRGTGFFRACSSAIASSGGLSRSRTQ